jgi:hypothetical protein
MSPRYIIIHHSLTEDGTAVNWGAIRKFHMTDPSYRFRDIGYHFGVELVRDQYEILLGRMPDEDGAHCREMGMNFRSIGICCIGNFDDEDPPIPQWLKTAALVRALIKIYAIPACNVLGHREVGERAGYNWRNGHYKSCPGAAFNMSNFREALR